MLRDSFPVHLFIALTALLMASCSNNSNRTMENESMSMDDRLAQYTPFELNTDMSQLSENQREMISLLIDAAGVMEEVFWLQAYGNKEELMISLESSELRRFAEINYGPWDRLNANEPFVEGVGQKPLGANFYPADMTKEEFEAWDSDAKDDLYTIVRRDDNGELVTIAYHEAYSVHHRYAADKLREV